MRLYRHGLWIVLGLALLARLAPMVFDRQVGRDITEYQNLAENLRAGHGFFLDLKTYWVSPTPVVHYGLYERPVLLPALLAAVRLVASPAVAAQVIGPLLYLLTLTLIYVTVRREVGPGAALGVGLLLALQPTLFELSLAPLSEATTMLALGLIVWTFSRLKSPHYTGLACSLAFLARPSMLLVAGIVGLAYLIDAIRNRQVLNLVSFTIFAALGPLWLMAFNHAMGVPRTLLPQSFLFRVVSYEDTINYFHRGQVYSSVGALWREHGAEVARRILGHNVLYYLKAMSSSAGLGLLVPLMPLAVVGLWRDPSLRRWGWLALIAAADLGLYVISWSTFDANRFLCIFYVVAITLIVIGACEILDREPLGLGKRAWHSAAFFSILAVALVWLVMDAERGYLAMREWQINKPSAPVKILWAAPGVDEVLQALRRGAGKLDPEQPKPVVASNEPWMIYHGTGLPAVKLPYDLQGEEWLAWLQRYDAAVVVLHLGDWPTAQNSCLAELEAALTQAGWQRWIEKGQVRAWSRPLKQARPDAPRGQSGAVTEMDKFASSPRRGLILFMAVIQ